MSLTTPACTAMVDRVLAIGIGNSNASRTLWRLTAAACLLLPACEHDSDEAAPTPRKPAPEPPTTADPSGPIPTAVEPAAHELVDLHQVSIAEQQRDILALLEGQGMRPEAMATIRRIFEASGRIGYGNPDVSRAAMTQTQCRQRRQSVQPSRGHPRCSAPNMVPVYEVNSGQSEANARVCIDQYEFPNEPCEYPVVWARASEAAAICAALGKRLCDSHEWEGACAARPLAPEVDYGFDRVPKRYAPSQWKEKRLFMEHEHNETREVLWAYGAEQHHELCATSSKKGARCTDASFENCGSNTYPTGAFPECRSALGVYDQHGNVAEHMSLPLEPSELGGHGWTEMKGSWFIFANEATHPDDCRWRAKNWHTTRIDDDESHRSYHLGFRCCKDIAPR